MDWTAAIEKHRAALVQILASLVAMAGQDLGVKPSPVLILPRHLRLAVLRLLRPAESAARRLIIVAARGLVVTLPPPRKAKPPQVCKTQIIPAIPRNGTGIAIPSALGGFSSACAKPRALSLPLFDPLQHPFRPRRPKRNGVPRISVPGVTEPFPVANRRPPAPGDMVDAGGLGRRLEALASVLDDLPRQALRFARWRIRRDSDRVQVKQSSASGRIRRLWPLRMGRPPGSRRRPSHEVHEVLAAAHGLAVWALQRRDTS